MPTRNKRGDLIIESIASHEPLGNFPGGWAKLGYEIWETAPGGTTPEGPRLVHSYGEYQLGGSFIPYGVALHAQGLRVGEMWNGTLPACNDTDGDGYDDTGRGRCLSYGSPASPLCDTTLWCHIQVYEIL